MTARNRKKPEGETLWNFDDPITEDYLTRNAVSLVKEYQQRCINYRRNIARLEAANMGLRTRLRVEQEVRPEPSADGSKFHDYQDVLDVFEDALKLLRTNLPSECWDEVTNAMGKIQHNRNNGNFDHAGWIALWEYIQENMRKWYV